ncbi:MAG: hypothetical protein HWN80_04960 [Candidatus Lokiarchaeota archaeon]|nr:hypothetical protein [Candidatus Lokiarchaeota archaeon]
MLELYSPDYEILNTKDRITIDLIKDGEEFLKQFDINEDFLLDTVSLIYRYLRIKEKIPHNLYKFYIAAYYIVTRHPFAFPAHETKKDFCKKFNLEISSLEYCVEKIASSFGYIKILDDMNFPYFMDPKRDLSLEIIKNIVKSKIEAAMMKFLLYSKPVNSQILTEELVSDIVFEHHAFPEELFRQLYNIVSKLVEAEFTDHNEYVMLQQKYFI